MYNHAYTLLLNTEPSALTQSVRRVDPDFHAVRVPASLGPFNLALYADCNTVTLREQRAESYLSVITTPELMELAIRFDPRNDYRNRVSTLLSMCTTSAAIPLTQARVDAVMTSVRLCPGLFELPAYSDDMALLRRTHYTAPDRYMQLGAALLAYVYQLEVARTH